MNYCGSQVRRQLWRVRRRREHLRRNRRRVTRVFRVGRHRGCLSSTTVDALCPGHLSLQEVAHRPRIPDFTLAGEQPTGDETGTNLPHARLSSRHDLFGSAHHCLRGVTTAFHGNTPTWSTSARLVFVVYL
jgi:hypothetical protein